MKFGLTEAQINDICTIMAKFSEIREAIIFGSRAMGNYKEASDVDIALKGDTTFSLAAKVKYDLEEETYLPFFFDVFPYEKSNHAKLKEHIDQYGVSFYRAGWKECTLGEIANIQTGPFGSQLHASDYVDVGIPVIMPKNIGHRLDIKLDSIAYITEKDAKRLQKYRVKPNDIVFSRRGDVEKCVFITNDMDGWLCGTGSLKVNFQSGNTLPRFMAYYFSTSESKYWLTSHAVGTTMPNLNSKILGKLPIFVPPIEEQRAISAVLSSLDDKIDLLHRQNKTLEAMAQALFRHWFVDGASDEWKKCQLEKFVEVMRGLSYKGAGLAEEEEGIPMHNLNSVYEGGGYKYEGIKYYKGAYKERHKVFPNDIIVTNTEQGHDLLLIGYPAVIPSFYGEGIFSQHVFRLNIFNPQITNQYLYYLLMSHDVREQITGATNGSTVNMLPKDGIEWATFRLPPVSLINRFSEIVQQYWDKKEANYKQIRTLEKLRDTLLPKLMSGAVRVKF